MGHTFTEVGKTKHKLKKKAPVHQEALDNVVGNDVEMVTNPLRPTSYASQSSASSQQQQPVNISSAPPAAPRSSAPNT
eukprot:gene37836-46688_t